MPLLSLESMILRLSSLCGGCLRRHFRQKDVYVAYHDTTLCGRYAESLPDDGVKSVDFPTSALLMPTRC